MTPASLFLVLGALSLVLALIALGVRLLKGAGVAHADTVPMRVVGRVGLGPRQGLATVRVGRRLMVVSVGEGGVRHVCDMEPDGALAESATTDSLDAGPAHSVIPGPWRRLIRAGGGALVLALLLAGPGASGAAAQGVAPPAVGSAPAGGQGVGVQDVSPGEAPAPDALSALSDALPDMQLAVGDEEGLRLSGTVGTVLVIGLLAMLPTLLLLMTSFTRILVVLHFLRQALGTQTAPPTQMIAALALLLTAFVMAPTLGRVNETAIRPWTDGQMDEVAMMAAAAGPFREFMAIHVRESDLATFVNMSTAPAPQTIDDVPLITLVSAFAISELRTAFQIGFVLFLPFLVIDLVVAAVLMSLGMFMLPPVMVSLPFKLLLFVLVDGWALVIQSLVASFG